MGKNFIEFADEVRHYVKNALPEELSGAEVCTDCMRLWDGVARMVLLVIRPQDGATTGFCLDKSYADYSDGKATVESAAAAIINNRGLYNMYLDNSNMQQSIAAIIYG